MDRNRLPSSENSTPQKASNASAGSIAPALQIREGQFDDLFPLMEIVTKELPLGRQHLALATLSDAVKGSGLERIASGVALRDGKVVAGALATRIAADAAQFIGFGCDNSVEPSQRLELKRSLSDFLHSQLLTRGFRFVQASCDATDHSPPCAAVGYEWIATLDYLQAGVAALLDASGNDRQGDPSSPWQPAGLDCIPIDPSESTASWHRIVNLVQSTYEQTLDCPRLNALRSATDVVGAYITASSFQPEGWRIITENGRDVACLVTVVHPATKALELTYMGISPSHRGRGIGRLLVGEAARIARKKAADRVMLAVDQGNRPACDVYRQCGFENIGSEAVWGRKLADVSSGQLSERTSRDVRRRPKPAA